MKYLWPCLWSTPFPHSAWRWHWTSDLRWGTVSRCSDTSVSAARGGCRCQWRCTWGHHHQTLTTCPMLLTCPGRWTGTRPRWRTGSWWGCSSHWTWWPPAGPGRSWWQRRLGRRDEGHKCQVTCYKCSPMTSGWGEAEYNHLIQITKWGKYEK